jgi:hypothetical protein
MAFRNFTTGNSHSFGGRYLELTPDERIRYTDQFDDPNLPGEMVTTVTLRAVACGAELSIVQEGIPEAIPTEFCYLGWQESLEHLARLVEPEIPTEAVAPPEMQRRPSRGGAWAGGPGMRAPQLVPSPPIGPIWRLRSDHCDQPDDLPAS